MKVLQEFIYRDHQVVLGQKEQDEADLPGKPSRSRPSPLPGSVTLIDGKDFSRKVMKSQDIETWRLNVKSFINSVNGPFFNE